MSYDYLPCSLHYIASVWSEAEAKHFFETNLILIKNRFCSSKDTQPSENSDANGIKMMCNDCAWNRVKKPYKHMYSEQFLSIFCI